MKTLRRNQGRRSGFWLFSVLMSTVALSCGSTQRPRAPGVPKNSPVIYEMEPVKIEAVREGDAITLRDYDAEELFELAEASNRERRFEEAAGYYQKLLESFPDARLAPAALFNLARVNFDLERHQEAADLFNQFIARYPTGTDARDAMFLRGVSLGKLERWSESEAVFVALLERDDLTPDDRVEALARRGLARLRQGDLDDAEQRFRLVFVYRDKLESSAEARLDTDYYLAFAQYHLAEVAHLRSNATPLRWPEAQMSKDLEQKAALLLLARRRYIDAVRYGNAHIAQMAAYRIGSLFQEFYDAVMAVPPPADLDGEAKAEARAIYFEELKKKLRVVLEKALRGHEHNLELFERLGVESEWVTKSRTAIERLRKLLDPDVSLDVATPSTFDGASDGANEPPPPRLHDDRGGRMGGKGTPAVQRQIL